ncbi:MAG TPA: hypothetical protein V6D28_07740 [Leptolyngbyaceae cyanobacterium]
MKLILDLRSPNLAVILPRENRTHLTGFLALDDRFEAPKKSFSHRSHFSPLHLWRAPKT